VSNKSSYQSKARIKSFYHVTILKLRERILIWVNVVVGYSECFCFEIMCPNTFTKATLGPTSALLETSVALLLPALASYYNKNCIKQFSYSNNSASNLWPIEAFFFLPRCSHTWERAPVSEHRADFTQFLNLGQSVGLLGRVISSSQGLYLFTNTEKHIHIHKH
jgi:hypothetical protein